MKLFKWIVLCALGMSLAGCSQNSCFVIVNLTGHDLVVLYKFKPGTTYSTALSNTPRVLSFTVDGSDYVQDSVQQELTFNHTDTVKVRVPNLSMFSGAESAHAFLDYSFDKVDWLMIIRTDLGDTMKVSGSLITDIIREVNDQDMGLVIDYKPLAGRAF